MGTSRTPAELASKFRHAGGAVRGAARDGVGKAALLVKTSVLSQLPTTRLRGVGKRGAKIGVRYDIKGTQNPTALVRATGPFQLIERDTKAHKIEPKKRRSGKRAIVTPQGPRAWAFHPGTKGKHPWEKGVQLAIPKVRTTMVSEQAKSLRRFFG